MSEPSSSASFPALRNSLAVLRSFESGDVRLGVTEISERTGLHKSSVSRLLVALEDEGLVARDPESRRYALALGLVQLAGPFLGSLDIRHAARPVVATLRDKTQETAALIQWTGTEAVVIEEVKSAQEIAHNTPVGTRYRTALSSSVQVFLSEYSVDEARALLNATPPLFADVEMFTIPAYLDELAQGRRSGVFRNVRRSAPDAIGLAAPVRDHRGDLVAAILLAAPAFRITEEMLATRVNQVRTAAADASSALGCRTA